MRIISFPARFRVATALLFACVPVAAIEVYFMRRSPAPPNYVQMGAWSAIAFVSAIAMTLPLRRAQRWPMYLMSGLTVIWSAQASTLALRMGSNMIWVALLILGLMSACSALFYSELRRPCFDPNLKWYEGVPPAIPGVSCELGKGVSGLRVSRLGHDGIFVFHREEKPVFGKEFLKSEKQDLTLSFRGKQIECQAVPFSALSSGRGAGFRFEGLKPDTQKELGDFIETLRGEGYV